MIYILKVLMWLLRQPPRGLSTEARTTWILLASSLTMRFSYDVMRARLYCLNLTILEKRPELKSEPFFMDVLAADSYYFGLEDQAAEE